MYKNSLIELFATGEVSSNKIVLNSYTKSLVNITEDIRNDLENLLNTPRLPLSFPPGLAELVPSLVDYGIPNYLNYTLITEKGREFFCKKLEKIISLYEPRLKNVKVSYKTKESDKESQGVMPILIQGEINLQAEIELISYSLLLNPCPDIFVVNLERI